MEQRFWSKVDKTGDCWLWTGSLTSGGYGSFWQTGGPRRAHRVAYELCVGTIPEGLSLDHTCRMITCVNPAHLEPVTHAENVRRGRSGTKQRAKTHCPSGHEYTSENTYNVGYRLCKACVQQRNKARWAKHKGE